MKLEWAADGEGRVLRTVDDHKSVVRLIKDADEHVWAMALKLGGDIVVYASDIAITEPPPEESALFSLITSLREQEQARLAGKTYLGKPEPEVLAAMEVLFMESYNSPLPTWPVGETPQA